MNNTKSPTHSDSTKDSTAPLPTSAKPRRVLGRGLSALLPTADKRTEDRPTKVDDAQPGLHTVEISRIKPRSDQPRKRFEPGAMEELKESIAAKGILQPLVVAPSGSGGFDLIAGERRLRAAKLAGLTVVPVVVRPQGPAAEAYELALIENIQREDLNVLEVAQGYQTLIDKFGLTQEQVAKRVGKSRSAVANTLRVLGLPEVVRRYIAEGQLTAGQVRPLIAVKDAAEIERLATAIVRQGLSARHVEAQVGATRPPTSQARKKGTEVATADPHLAAIQDRLRRRFATKVEVHESNGKGRISLHFFSVEELGHMLELMGVD